uniref:Importin N-terminal domain-containing protein n=1 Tax=Tetradesmus obliquus TaxID=3088 RepID=A0A383V7P9_TETOB|eukprot:jgi/Sobl393_1/3494/SZX60983.1
MADQVVAAITALYGSDDAAVRSEADRWLERWQSSSEAWTVANAILHNPSSGAEYTYFCAQTLKTKVQRDYEELPAESVPQLRDSLLQLLLRFGHGSPAVRTQLCLAMAALAAHLPAAQWSEGGVLRWLMERFSGQDPAVAMSCMLELLTVLPQEADSRKIACRPERRAAFAAELRAIIPDALQLLTSCLGQPGETVRGQVLESLGCWLKLSGGSDLPQGLAGSALVTAALEGLGVDGTFHAAVDAVVELIWITVDPASCVPNPEMTGLAQLLVGRVMALRPRFSVALHKAIAESEGRDGGNDNDVDDEFDDDSESVKGMARLFCEVAEAYIQLVLAATPEVLPPVEALLDVTAHPEHDIFSMSFGFWHKLSRQLSTASLMQEQQQQQAPGLPVQAAAAAATNAAAAEQQRRREFFRPAFEKLISLVRGRMRLPDGYSSMRNSERADWRRHRHAWADVLVDACDAVGQQRALQLLLLPLTEVSQGVAAGREFDWKTAELALHCVRSVACMPFAPTEPMLEQLLTALPTLPPKPPQLPYTSALLLSAYAEWLDKAISAGRCGNIIPQLLPMLLTALGDPVSAPAAAIAIRDLCDCCGKHMGTPHILEQLMALYAKTLEAGAATKTAAAAAAAAAAGDAQGVIAGPVMTAAQRTAAAGAAVAAAGNAVAAAGALHEDDVHCVIQGMVMCLSRCLPEQQLPAGLITLARPLLQPVTAAMQQFTPSLGAGETALAAHLPLFDRLATLFQSMKQQQAAATILQQAWVPLDVALLRGATDRSAVERLCRVLRYGIKASGKSCAPLLPTLLETLPGRFQQTRHPAFMYVVSELLKIFCAETAADGSMRPILTALIGSSCAGLTTLQAMDDQPDLVDDTFLLAGRAAAYCPRLLLVPQLLPQLLDTALLGVLVQHREACRSVLSFLSRLFDPASALTSLQDHPGLDQAASVGLLEQQLLRVGPALTRMLLGGAVGALPQSRVEDIAPVLQAMLKLAGQKGALQWITECATLIPDVALTAGDRQAFLAAAAAVVQGNTGMDGGCPGLEEALEAMSDLCRRNKRAMKAAQCALLPQQLHGALGLA